jgi:ectoine hydroxylase-related dioxygenase (phytanoyl-CoA dioxygenase family)
MERDGYVFLRGLLDRQDVLKARVEILRMYAIIGEVDDRCPISDGIDSARSSRDAINVRAFLHAVSSGARYQAVCRNEALLSVVSDLLGERAMPFDFCWPRMIKPGHGCGMHVDAPWHRGAAPPERIYTAWLPLGDIALEDGPLMVLERSHLAPEIRDDYASADSDREQVDFLPGAPPEVARRLGLLWRSTDFRAGDALIFSMFTLHASLDNRSPDRRWRLSSDTRYQSFSERLDPRFAGESPQGRFPDKVFFPGRYESRGGAVYEEYVPVDEFGRIRIPR